MDAFFGQNTGRGPRPRVQRGQDALLRMTIDLAEAAFGVTQEIKVDTAVTCTTCSGSGAAEGSEPVTCRTCHGHGDVQHVQRSLLGDIRTSRPCPTCHGYGTVIPEPCAECAGEGRVRSRRSISVTIPPGVDHGTRIQLSGEGEVGPGGGPAGDLYLEINVPRHPMFTRKGDQLFCQVTLPMTAAALGAHLDLPTLEADVVDADEDTKTVAARRHRRHAVRRHHHDQGQGRAASARIGTRRPQRAGHRRDARPAWTTSSVRCSRSSPSSATRSVPRR